MFEKIFEFITSFIENNSCSSITVVMLLILFCIATITDIMDREIPIFLCAIVFVLSTVLHYIYGVNFSNYIIASAVLAMLYFLEAVLSTGSGGDIILFATLGYCAGIVGGLVTSIISGVLATIYCLIISAKKHAFRDIEYPVAPFVLLGYIGYLMLTKAGVLSGVEMYVQKFFQEV